ncbi:MAG: hypothetical protein K1Y36_00180 [Blastocatellia bacterium]|nr:hypothetical protein [Blastocatellia bacterium]
MTYPRSFTISSRFRQAWAQSWRFFYVTLRLAPFLVSFLRDRKRFLAWGNPRELPLAGHERRARRLVDTFAHLGPAFIKLSQILAVREDLLPKLYAREFSRLLDQTPAADFSYVAEIIRRNTDSEVDDLFFNFDRKPMASASIGQVHRAQYRNQEVVVKVRRPQVVETITLDNEILTTLMAWMRPFFERHYLYRGFEVVLGEYKRIVAAELDFRLEADNAERIRSQTPRHPRLVIPRFYPEMVFDDLLVMEFCEGVRIDQVETIREFGVDLSQLIENLLEVVFSQLLVHGFFHADPHPGNILINRKGEIVLLDFGMTDELDPQTRDDFLGLILAAHNNEYDEVMRKLHLLQMVDADTPEAALRTVTETVLGLRHLARTHQRQVQMAVEELFEKTRILHHLQMPRQMVYLLRVGTLIEGVAIRFDENFDSITDAVPIAKRVGLRTIARIVPFGTAVRYTAEVMADRVDAFLGQLTQQKNVALARNLVQDVTRWLKPALPASPKTITLPPPPNSLPPVPQQLKSES